MERLVVWHRVLPPTRVAQDAPDAAATWAAEARRRFAEARGQWLGTVGTSFAMAYDLPELAGALDLSLALLDEADAALDPPGGLPVAIGVATGVLEAYEGGPVGSALQRAELLANRARRGELVLDAATRELSETTYLFGRSVGAGAAVLRGSTIDRATPHRAACRRALSALAPVPVVPAIAGALGALDVLTMRGQATDAVVLRGPSGAGAETYLEALAQDRPPAAWLRLAGVPGALEPLGSLRFALRRRWAEEPATAAEASLGDGTLRRVAWGDVVPRAEVVAALVRLFSAWREASGGDVRPWLSFDPAMTVDRATWGVVADAVEATPAFVIARTPVDAPLPGDLARLPLVELVVPALRLEDAKRVARTVLGSPDGDGQEAARRVAVLGGDSPLGVLEAARTLIAAGDLIPGEEGFHWRVAPRPGMTAIPLEDLYAERLGGLDAAPLRMLEAVCLCPPGTPAAVVAGLADADGLGHDEQRAAMALLAEDALVAGDPPQPGGELLRRLVVSSMPPSRAAELHRYLGDAMDTDAAFAGPLARATVGWVRGEGGQGEAASKALLTAARGALDAGFRRDAQRLAAAAVQLDPTAAVRGTAGELSRGASLTPAQEGSVPPAATTRASDAVDALLRGDLEAAERTLDKAIAEGRSLAAADRMRALTHLARGDMGSAMVALGRARRIGERDPERRARASLTLSWIRLQGEDADRAVRSALEGLAAARLAQDSRGEAAALLTLAACYRALGRGDDAARLARAAAG